MSSVPDFDSLPKVDGMPQGCAWGIFDKDGQKDMLGTLNLLTPDVVKNAALEVKEGVSVSLNWPIGAIRIKGHWRKGLTHKVTRLDMPGIYGFDDEVEFNTQCSTQWDSLCHLNHEDTGTCYNGAKPSPDDMVPISGSEDKLQNIPTLHHWHSRGGLVGRGVLIDYKSYAEANNINYDPYTPYSITTADIEAVAASQQVTFKYGDIIIIRMAFTAPLLNKTGEEQVKTLMAGGCCGVKGSIDTAKWFWNHHFAAVAGDMIAFEALPDEDGKYDSLTLHQYFLSLFGMSIGELWDLDALAEQCKKIARYSFMLTSVPLNVPGLVGSPANAVAIF